MKKVIDQITDVVSEAFEIAGFDPALGKCTVSNRPDLCQYQCNGVSTWTCIRTVWAVC